jgi:hypothetical protein
MKFGLDELEKSTPGLTLKIDSGMCIWTGAGESIHYFKYFQKLTLNLIFFYKN